MTVLVEQYWREIRDGFDRYAIPVRHFVLHADQDVLRRRIDNDTVLAPVPSEFRLRHLQSYADAANTWLPREAEVVDTTTLAPEEAAVQIAASLQQ